MSDPDPREATRQLAIAAQTGDREPFNALYERVAPAVLSWAAVRIPQTLRARLGPEDLVQEVWFRAYKKLADYDGTRPFRAWIFGFANRVLLEVLRQRRPTVDVGHAADGGFDLQAVPEDATAITMRAARNERTGALIAYLHELDRDDRTLAALRGLEGLPFEDVARQLDITPAVARKRWERLRQRLQGVGIPDGLLVEED